eukprot:3977836-Amphidinium_carterae.1
MECSPAYTAVSRGHAAVLEMMLRNSRRDTGVNTVGADNQSILDADDGISFFGCTALHRAAYHDDPDA